MVERTGREETIMDHEEIQSWLSRNKCTVEYLDNGNVKVSLKQADRKWSIERKDLRDAVEATNYSDCIVG